MERTLAIIKPDSVRKKVVGAIIDKIERAGFEIVAMKYARLTKAAAGSSMPCTRNGAFTTNW